MAASFPLRNRRRKLPGADLNISRFLNVGWKQQLDDGEIYLLKSIDLLDKIVQMSMSFIPISQTDCHLDWNLCG